MAVNVPVCPQLLFPVILMFFLIYFVAFHVTFFCFCPFICILHKFLPACFKCMFVCVCHSSVRLSLARPRLYVCPTRRRLHNVPSSSLCDFAERGPGSGCHPLPPSQHCPGTPDQCRPAAHRLAALPHQPAAHFHRPGVRGAGARLREHRALLPGVQRADRPLQRLWLRGIHEEGLGFTGPF